MKRVPPKTLFVDQGERTVIFLHSYTGSPNDFLSLTRVLAKQNISSYLPLFTGHGTLNAVDILQQGNPAAWWADTKAAIDFIRQKKQGPISVVGLSLGSLFALKALATMPDLKSGAVLGCPIFNDDLTNVSAGFYQYEAYLEQQQDLSVGQIAMRKRQVEQLLPQALSGIKQTALTVRQQLDKIKQPLFIGHGQKDPMVNIQSAKRLAAALPPKQVVTHFYQNAGHVITVNQARPQLEQDLENFLLVN